MISNHDIQADKGQQVRDGPQAFFLPLDQVSTEKSDFIDLETTTDKEATDLQEALRKKRPGKFTNTELTSVKKLNSNLLQTILLRQRRGRGDSQGTMKKRSKTIP